MIFAGNNAAFGSSASIATGLTKLAIEAVNRTNTATAIATGTIPKLYSVPGTGSVSPPPATPAPVPPPPPAPKPAQSALAPAPSFFEEHATALKIGGGIALVTLVGGVILRRRRA